MIFGKTKLEMKVGIFVFIGLIILVVFVLSIGGVKTWSSGYKVNFIFNFVNGVKNGAPVRFAVCIWNAAQPLVKLVMVNITCGKSVKPVQCAGAVFVRRFVVLL